MKRWVLLLTLPWAVAVSTREYNCTYVADVPADSTGYMEIANPTCETAQDWQLLYEGNPLVYCGPQAADTALRDHCEWMKDVAAAFNEMAIARRSKNEDADGESDPEPKK